jgi:hypothetical protein
MASLTITIEVTGGDPTVSIRDDAGNEKKVTGFVMFGFSPTRDELYGFSWGNAREAAKAVVEVVARACNAGDGWMQEFYQTLLGQFIKSTGVLPPGVQEITPEEALARWGKEDEAKWN